MSSVPISPRDKSPYIGQNPKSPALGVVSLAALTFYGEKIEMFIVAAFKIFAPNCTGVSGGPFGIEDIVGAGV